MTVQGVGGRSRPYGADPLERGSTGAHACLVRAICELLRLRRIPCTPVNQVPRQRADGRWHSPGADPGAWDVVACMPGGRVLWIEAKTGTGRVSVAQAAFAGEWTRAGGSFLACRGVVELAEYLDAVMAEEREGT